MRFFRTFSLIFLALMGAANAQCSGGLFVNCPAAVSPQPTDVLQLWQLGQNPHMRSVQLQNLWTGSLASPPCIGCTTPNAGAFTTLSATGTTAFPTQTFGDNSTKAATTAFVQAAAVAAPGCFGVAGSLCNVGSGATALTDGATPLYFQRVGPSQAPAVGEWQFSSTALGNVTALRSLYYDGSNYGFSAQTARSMWGYEHGAFGCDEGGLSRATTVSANVTITGNVMTVAAGLTGTITNGMDILIASLYTTGTAGPLPMVVQQISGTTGGAGTYQISSATGDPRTLNISVSSSTAATMGIDPTFSCGRTFIETSDGLLNAANTTPNEFSLLQSYATGGTRAQHVMLDITTTSGGDNIGDMYWDRTSGGNGSILHSIHSNGFLAVSGTVSGTFPVDAFDVYLAASNCMVVGRQSSNRGQCSYGTNGEDLEIHSATPILRWRTDNTAIADLFLDATNKRLGVMDPANGGGAPVWFYVDGSLSTLFTGGVNINAVTGLSLTATAGFVALPFTAGIPTGAPTLNTNCAIDTTNGYLNCYYGAAWHSIAFASGAH